MLKIVKFSICLLAINLLAGCSGLAKMKNVDLVESAEPGLALVSIVRPSVFVGDGAKAELWDGEKFIGTLESGTMIQYLASPGEHTFMVSTQGSWGVAKGELKANKKYFLKYNVGFGFITLGVAESDDTRIGTWKETLTPKEIDATKSKAVPEKTVNGARKILQEIEDGTAKYELISEANAI